MVWDSTLGSGIVPTCTLKETFCPLFLSRKDTEHVCGDLDLSVLAICLCFLKTVLCRRDVL